MELDPDFAEGWAAVASARVALGFAAQNPGYPDYRSEFSRGAGSEHSGRWNSTTSLVQAHTALGIDPPVSGGLGLLRGQFSACERGGAARPQMTGQALGLALPGQPSWTGEGGSEEAIAVLRSVCSSALLR